VDDAELAIRREAVDIAQAPVGFLVMRKMTPDEKTSRSAPACSRR
jgi:hypothetical protein